MPRFRLKVWDTGLTELTNGSKRWIHGFTKYKLAYELSMHQGRKTVLFKGFCASPLHTINSDATMLSIMDLLTLRPGDTDKEYFAKYTPEQLEFCARHAEALSYEVWVRFGE
jgi:hypothetical protein